jgi:hypothetical protein
MVKRVKWDKSRPDTKAVVDSIVHGVFVKEGTMVAFPMSFPGATVPIERDESHITALDTGTDGLIYGGTTGRRVHLFVGMFHGVTGIVLDMGVVEGATRCQSVACIKDHLVAGVNGPKGGRMVTRKYEPLPFDLLQEWWFSRPEYTDLGSVGRDDMILDLAANPSKDRIVGLSSKHVFLIDAEASSVRIIDEIAGFGRLAAGSLGGAMGASPEGKLWRLDPEGQKLDRAWMDLPPGDWSRGISSFAADPASGVAYLADAAGRIFCCREDEETLEEVGRTDLAPVSCMAATFDGRLFGVCGEGVSRLFQYDPGTSSLDDLGVAVSVIERRRYGYEFGAATVGRDGEIVFGEDDDLGHLWLYFPKIVRR